ncbi:hypothetical protein Plhal304r1_c018g0064531 [Plasmopara halstedii]
MPSLHKALLDKCISLFIQMSTYTLKPGGAIGRSQTWTSLVEAAECPQGVEMRYAQNEIVVLGILPVPTASGSFRRRTRDQPAADVSFDMLQNFTAPLKCGSFTRRKPNNSRRSMHLNECCIDCLE